MPMPRKPTALHDLEGTRRPDRHPNTEPTPPVGLPDRPPWVDEDELTSKLFDAVTRYVDGMRVSTQVDGIALGLLADQMGLYITLREEIRQKGVMVDSLDTKGQPKRMSNPALPQANQVLGHIFKFLREYGLTAASRANVSVESDKKVDEFDDFLG